ncbi:hypothetical protein [Methylobacterium sp. J-070]|uniref:hypothetical protein n=1 Tax=Methylobacterium sp. J-070 TaxID=2836650 RepID=UPI001FB8C0FC|nr:hypothetical protein [Methylobacterium sp. J-070]MCJ2053926.1 hypothetical protein [Methylobacterium sp. J-070]
MRAAEPDISATVADLPVKSATVANFTHGIRALSRTEVETLVEGLIDLLDAWDGDTDLEDSADSEPSLCGLVANWPSLGGDDREFDLAEGRDPIPAWSGRGVHEVFVGRRA